MYLQRIKQGKNTYYCLAKSARVDGKPRIVWQKYVGTVDDIARMAASAGRVRLHTYPYGKLTAFLSVADELNLVDIIDRNTSKKKIHGLSVGQYLLLIILNRLTKPTSKRGVGKWFDKTFLSLAWKFDHKLNEQNFWNHMKKLDDKAMEGIELELTKTLIGKGIKPERLILDTTNFFTYLQEGDLAKKGKSKDGRHGKNLLGFGLAVGGDNVPFVHTVYEGNKHDSRVFKDMVDKITSLLGNAVDTNLVAVFDKGNNSRDNIADLKISFIGSLQRRQIKELLDVPKSGFDLLYENRKGHKFYGYRTRKKVFGGEYAIVVAYNEQGYQRERKKFDDNLEKAKKSLEELGEGRKYDAYVRSVEDAIPKDVKSVVRYQITGDNGFKVQWRVNEDAKVVREKGFGKTVLFTDLGWETSDIVKAYNDKYLVEDDFKLLKDRLVIPVPPVYHRRKDMQKAHIFLCVMGLLLLRYLMHECKEFGLSRNELLEELEGIRLAVVKEGKTNKTALRFEEMTTTQCSLLGALRLDRYIP